MACVLPKEQFATIADIDSVKITEVDFSTLSVDNYVGKVMEIANPPGDGALIFQLLKA
jgi:hypothetical protein